MAKIVETPLMKQYVEMKRRHPDAVLLFRVGDFYETFSDDAVTASEILGITLTRRANGSAQHVELAGFPHHALDTYLPKLVRAGKRVAICEQLEDPKLTKKLVKRGITEVITPGVTTSDTILDNRSNNFLAAVHFGPSLTGVAFLDISTGEFMAGEGTAAQTALLLERFAPKEVLVERGNRGALAELAKGQKAAVFELDDWAFNADSARDRLLRLFGTAGLKGFGVHHMAAAVIAAGAVIHYLDITEHRRTDHIRTLSRIDQGQFVHMDRFTVRALELLHPMGEEGTSLLDIVDRTQSPMGARLLARWLAFPLKEAEAINERLDVVEHFVGHDDERAALAEAIGQVGDLERLVGKVATQRIAPREVRALSAALKALAPVRDVCSASRQPVLERLAAAIDPCHALRQRINATVIPDPASALNRGRVIADGVDPELDELRLIAGDGRRYLNELQQRESRATGIPSLKVGFNNVFGYYIEVTNTHRDKVPSDWVRKQTLVNAERYITPELKDYEQKIVSAEERIAVIEDRIYRELVAHIAESTAPLQTDAATVARLDCLLSFAQVSVDNRYVRPVVDDSLELELTAARHPVIERRLPPGEPYIANDIRLSNRGQQVIVITGPNMSGKSAVLRQTALNVILAQTGCFVAASAARIGVVDKIFTRVGASDNLAQGESTFMVEMSEAAAILNNMSERSLIVFDELGRGTSTYDGISIAWAVVEYIHEHAGHPKTLFATHYHELNEMEGQLSRVVNYNVSVKEIDGKVVFLRKLERGGTAHSFGIHVARLTGMPPQVVSRADSVLAQLEKAAAGGAKPAEPGKDVAAAASHDSGMQLSFFQLDDPVLSQLRDTILGLDINRLTPLEALTKLNEIRGILTGS